MTCISRLNEFRVLSKIRWNRTIMELSPISLKNCMYNVILIVSTLLIVILCIFSPNFQFKEILYIDETTKQSAYFQRESDVQLKPSNNFGDKAQYNGLWVSQGVASKSYKYQLLICDTRLSTEDFLLVVTRPVGRDVLTGVATRARLNFRTASTDPSYAGVAFNINGHTPRARRLVSVGIR